ncbi:MAG: hypothetical protein PHW45_04135 [Candidatus ainarchaeum sp.]|nr:hypothetical protein [Candidatus ainarchaeum sp.]
MYSDSCENDSCQNTGYSAKVNSNDKPDATIKRNVCCRVVHIAVHKKRGTRTDTRVIFVRNNAAIQQARMKILVRFVDKIYVVRSKTKKTDSVSLAAICAWPKTLGRNIYITPGRYDPMCWIPNLANIKTDMAKAIAIGNRIKNIGFWWSSRNRVPKPVISLGRGETSGCNGSLPSRTLPHDKAILCGESNEISHEITNS